MCRTFERDLFMMTETLRPELGPLPERLRNRPICRGYPVPWFVGKVNGEYEFRCMDPAKLVRAVKERRCWVCGQVIGDYAKGESHPEYTFVIGPMCGVNRISSEPPSHLECAIWSAQNCPFLSKPHMVRREDEFMATCPLPAGVMIERNPGVSLLWTTRTYKVV